MVEGFVHPSINRDTRVRLKGPLEGCWHGVGRLSTLLGVANVTN